MAQIVRVCIPKWSDFNPRKDVSRPTWFRLEHSVFEDPKFYNLKSENWAVLLYLLCQRSKTREEHFDLNFDHAERVARLKKSNITKTLEILISSGFITATNADVTCTNADERGRHVRGPYETDGRDERDEEDASEGSCDPASVASAYVSLSQIFIERKVGIKIQTAWQSAFPDTEWTVEEIRKALAWELAVPNRRKKNFAAFITRWLTKGWDQRRLPSGQQTPRLRGIEEILADEEKRKNANARI